MKMRFPMFAKWFENSSCFQNEAILHAAWKLFCSPDPGKTSVDSSCIFLAVGCSSSEFFLCIYFFLAGCEAQLDKKNKQF